MTTLPNTRIPRLEGLPFQADSSHVRRLPEQRTFLLFSDDEDFYERFRIVASRVSAKLIRKRTTATAPETLRRFKPAAILVDLDLTSTAVWDTANVLLQDPNSPPLLLFTSRSEQVDFKAAIDAGLLVNKSEPPVRLLELLDATTVSPRTVQRQRMAMQQIVIRWLKPFNSLSENVPLNRFWGINE